MVKNFRCPGCGATIEYDPQDGKMHCPYCRSTYTPEELGAQKAVKAVPPDLISRCILPWPASNTQPVPGAKRGI